MLPLLFGLGGSALAGAGMLGGMSALTAGALGSGLGSLAQGDDIGTAIGTGLMSYMGGKGSWWFRWRWLRCWLVMRLCQQPPTGVPMLQAWTANPANFGLKDFGAAGMQWMTGGQGAMNALTSNLGQTAGIALPGLASLGAPQAGALAPLSLMKVEISQRRNRQTELQKMPPLGYRPGLDPEFRYFNEGGIASLAYQEGGDMDMSEAPNDKELISRAVEAIQGRSDNPEIVLGQFVARYGEDALRDLVGRVQSGEFDMNAMVTEGQVNGVGDGMDDMIPATLEGEQDVVLSDGEFIVPADVVSGLGNGSTDAGSKALYEMMDRVREMRTGMTKQPEQVPQGMMLPA